MTQNNFTKTTRSQFINCIRHNKVACLYGAEKCASNGEIIDRVSYILENKKVYFNRKLKSIHNNYLLFDRGVGLDSVRCELNKTIIEYSIINNKHTFKLTFDSNKSVAIYIVE